MSILSGKAKSIVSDKEMELTRDTASLVSVSVSSLIITVEKSDLVQALKDIGITAADFEERPAEEPKKHGRRAAYRMTFEQQFEELPVQTLFYIDGNARYVYRKTGKRHFARDNGLSMTYEPRDVESETNLTVVSTPAPKPKTFQEQFAELPLGARFAIDPWSNTFVKMSPGRYNNVGPRSNGETYRVSETHSTYNVIRL